MTYIQRSTNNGQTSLTIPGEVMETTGWQPGMEISFNRVGPMVQPQDGDIIIRPTGIIKPKS